MSGIFPPMSLSSAAETGGEQPSEVIHTREEKLLSPRLYNLCRMRIASRSPEHSCVVSNLFTGGGGLPSCNIFTFKTTTKEIRVFFCLSEKLRLIGHDLMRPEV